MKIYTRTGDEGTTGLFGGERVRKSHPRIAAYGTVDETNAHVGLARAHLRGDAPGRDTMLPLLERVQSELFVLGADLATPTGAKAQVPRITPAHVAFLEEAIDDLEEDLPALKHFILPGGSLPASALHVARTTCRRAERLTVEAGTLEPINEQSSVYLNRLSDFLFVAARWVNRAAGIDEAEWRPETSTTDAD